METTLPTLRKIWILAHSYFTQNEPCQKLQGSRAVQRFIHFVRLRSIAGAGPPGRNFSGSRLQPVSSQQQPEAFHDYDSAFHAPTLRSAPKSCDDQTSDQ